MLSRSEFAKLCGLGKNGRIIVRSYILRGQLIEKKNGLDPKNPINAAFILQRKARTPLPDKEKKPVMKLSKFEISQEEKDDLASAKEKFSLDKQKRRAEVSKLEQEMAIQDLKLNKLTGQLLPTELIRTFIAQLFKGQVIANKHSIDHLMVEFAKKARLNRNDIAEMRKHLSLILNRSLQDCLNEARKTVDNIIAEYSQRTKSA